MKAEGDLNVIARAHPGPRQRRRRRLPVRLDIGPRGVFRQPPPPGCGVR
ncbi:hypothetical protein ACFP9V_16870 [Deinococcus radiopugnans]